MELYVVRHGESVANLEHRFSGWSEIPLTEKGKEQAAQTGRGLKDMVFDRIISSDQLRAKQTAECVFPGCDYTVDSRIREIDVGSMLQDRLRDECLEEYGDKLWRTLELRDFSPFKGESLEDHKKRVYEFMRDLETLPEDSKIAVVTHGGAILCMLCYVLQMDVPHRAVEVINASVTCFKRENGEWRLYKWCENYR